VVAHAFNLSAWEAEAGRFLSSRSGLQSEFQDSQGYTEKLCLENTKKKKKKKKKSSTGLPIGRNIFSFGVPASKMTLG